MTGPDAVTAPNRLSSGRRGMRPSLERLSLRARIGILAAAVAAAVVVLVSVAVFVSVRESILDALDENLYQRATAAAQSELANPRALASLPPGILGAGDIRIALVYSSGLAQSAEGQASAPPLGGPELEVARGEEEESFRTAGGYRVVAVAAGEGRALVIAQKLDATQQVTAQLAVLLPVIGGVGVVLAAIAGLLVARAGLRPVQRLTRAAERVTATGELTPIPVTGSDELARLTQSFNEMLGGLAASQEQQRRLVADAGHELRTPLTSLRTNLELLAAAEEPGAPTLPDDDRREMLTDVRAQVEELSQLVGDLVELARDDSPAVMQEPVELTDAVERALERVRRRAGDAKFDVTLVPWTLVGDGTALERAVLNLLDNAVKWSPPGGTVRLRMVPLDGWTVVIEVADSGAGIAEADRPHVFDRFYRADTSRTMPGSGLGLAIVRQVAIRHGGAVWADRAPEGGALLAMRLPGHPG